MRHAQGPPPSPRRRGVPIRGNGYRWGQAVLALVIMLLISPYEYCFTIFEEPIAKAHGWSLPSVATTYTVYIVVASLMMIPSGLWSDRWQPRWFTTLAGIVTGLGWIMASSADSRFQLYLAYGLGALGPGYIYCSCVNNALKWFPESRGRGTAVGLIEMGFGLGSAIFIPLLKPIIDSGPLAYKGALVTMGTVMMVVIAVAAQFLRYPRPGWLPPGYDPVADEPREERGLGSSRADFTPMQMVRTWQYWWALVGLTFISAAGLMITAHIAVVASARLVVGGAAVGLASATFSRIPNGVMRWISGGLSDHFGRERLMAVFFILMGLFTYLLTIISSGPAFFVLTLLAMGCWGPMFTLYPALVGDYWGRGHSGVNYGLIYGPGKGLAGIFAGTIAAALYTASGTWVVPFQVAGLVAVVSGFMAVALTRPTLKVAEADPVVPPPMARAPW